ncbi:MAG: hypothetical protein WCJ30_28925 [Deltaproteobacteria bacterium]
MSRSGGGFSARDVVIRYAPVAAMLSVSVVASGCGEMSAPMSDAQADSMAIDDTLMCDDGGVCEAIDPPAPDEPVDAGAMDVASTDATDVDSGAPVTDSGVSIDAGPAVAPLPTCGNVNQRLLDDFGIIIRPGTIPFEGLATEDIGCAARISVYQMFMRPFQYVRYPVRLRPADPFTMHLYHTASPTAGSCSAYVPSAHAMQVRDLSQCLRVVSGTADPDFIRIAMFLIHESGHIIMARNSSLRTAFQAANLPAHDPGCYDRGFLKTYSLRTTTALNESFAEAAALFIGRRKVGRLATISNFATECPNTFAWIQTMVFGSHL